VQKLIAKYGTAAHLALLAVAPLFLFPFCGVATVATVLLWLSVPAFSWTVLEPSVRSGEALHIARMRVFRAMLADPLFWVSLVLVAVTGIRALNGGISLAYDAEIAKWNLSPAGLPIFPGCVEGTGRLPFAAMVAGAILLQGCRHSLGSSARMAFLFVSSSLAGLAGVVALLVASAGNVVVQAAMACSVTSSFYVGMAFYLHLLGGTVALVAAFERKWNLTMPLFAFSVGGTAAAGFLLSPPIFSLVFLAAEILLFGYVFVYSVKSLATSGEFKLLVIFGISLTLGGLLVMALEPSVTTERIAAFKALEFLPESLVSVRTALSGVALRSWLANLWLGTGLGSFPLAFRFSATPEDLTVVRAGAQAVPNGWLFLLAERGIVGALVVCLPVGFLLFTYFRRLVGWVTTRTYCHPACCLLPLVLAAVAVSGVYGCALLRADVTTFGMALLAVSANSFPRIKRKGNG